MAEWTEPMIEDGLRAVLRREADALPLTVTPHGVLARRRARGRRGRRARLALVAAASLAMPLSLAAGFGFLGSPQQPHEPTYLTVLARGLSTEDRGEASEHVTDLGLVLVAPDGHEEPVIQVPASRFAGWKTTREYALSPDGRWLAIPLQDALAGDVSPVGPALGLIDLEDPDRPWVLTDGRLVPVWAPDGTLWWWVDGQPRQVDLETGSLSDDADPAEAPARHTPAPAGQVDARTLGAWEVASTAWAADGGTWALVRRDPDTSDVSRLVHRDRAGVERWGPEFAGNTEMGIRSDALVMAPDDSLAAIRGHEYKSVSTGVVAPGRTIVVDVGTGQAFEHTGWLVGFVRSDAAAGWSMTEGGSR